MKKIALTKGKFALVDDEDFEYLKQWKWFAHKGSSTFYAARHYRQKGKQVCVHMHRLIIGDAPNLEVDHKNGNGLDNQRDNLRHVTTQQNRMNHKVQRNNKSGYSGISWNPINKRWRARITLNRVNINLGSFIEKEKAISVRKLAEIACFGEFARRQ